MESNERLRGIITIPRAEYRERCLANPSLFANTSYSDTMYRPVSVDYEQCILNRDQTLQRASPILPSELLLEILSYVTDSQKTLYAVSLVCRQWLSCVAVLLYRHPKISNTYRWASFILTLTRHTKLFPYGNFLHTVDLSSGKTIEAIKDQEIYRRMPSVQEITRTSSNATATAFTDHDRTAGSEFFQEQSIPAKGFTSIVMSTSSLIQLSQTCSRLTSINLSFTTLLFDSMIAETGEYISTLQHYAIRPELTQIQIPIEVAIQTIGKECKLLEEVKIQRCEWVTAHIIWLWAQSCPNLIRLDARHSSKCTVKRLVTSVLQAHQPKDDVVSDMESRSSQSSLMDRTTVNEFNTDTNDDAEEEDDDDDDDEEDDDDDDEGHNAYSHGTHNDFMEPMGSQSPGGTTSSFDISEDVLATILEEGSLLTTRRRPPSPRISHTAPYSDLNRANSYCTLQELILDILKDAKELGTMDLNWLQDI